MNHIEGDFLGYEDCSLYYQCWLPTDELEAVLLVSHGLAEHSGRYMNIVSYFVPKGYAVYALDHRGNGRSDGLRGDVQRFSHFVSDLDTFLSIVRRNHPQVKIFILGHSIGGTIAVAHALCHQGRYDGLILSGATLKVGSDVSFWLILIARILSLLLPKTGLYTIDASAICQDKTVVNAYVDDPLVYRGKIRARLGTEIINTVQRLSSRMSEIHLPVLIMHGTADRLSDCRGSEMLYRLVGSQDKTLKRYKDYYHEIFNEPGRGQVFADLEDWLLVHR